MSYRIARYATITAIVNSDVTAENRNVPMNRADDDVQPARPEEQVAEAAIRDVAAQLVEPAERHHERLEREQDQEHDREQGGAVVQDVVDLRIVRAASRANCEISGVIVLHDRRRTCSRGTTPPDLRSNSLRMSVERIDQDARDDEPEHDHDQHERDAGASAHRVLRVARA